MRDASNSSARAASCGESTSAMRSRTLSNTQPAGIQHKSSVTSNVPAITVSSCATPLEHDTCPSSGTQPPQMRADGATLRHNTPLDSGRNETELEIRRGKSFERLHEALQGRLHHAGADLPDPRLAMGNAGVDPGHDGRFDDLPDVNTAGHPEIVEHRQQQMGVTPGGNLQHLLGIAMRLGPAAHAEKLGHRGGGAHGKGT